MLGQTSDLGELRRETAVKDHHHEIWEYGPDVEIEDWWRMMMMKVWDPGRTVVDEPFHDDAEVDVFGVVFAELEEDGDMAEEEGMREGGL
jgi:hypothetical protein